jgi:glycosyltransferase involved in cell wall biosynthesis
VTEKALQFIRDRVTALEPEGPVVGFGMTGLWNGGRGSDIAECFPGLEFIRCAVRPGDDVEVLCNIERSQFPPSYAGTVVCLDSLERVAHPWLAVEDMFRILRPGGTLIVSASCSKPSGDRDDAFWRITSSGMAVLLKNAGFEEVLSWDGVDAGGCGDTRGVFCAATRPQGSTCGFPAVGDFKVEMVDGYRSSAITKGREYIEYDGSRSCVPFVIPLYGREEETRMVLEQLDKVTWNYRLVMIDNGFDDMELIQTLGDEAEYLRNDNNFGVIKAINQGIEQCRDVPYIAVMHSDAMIFEEGWLEHIIEFMERRPDVGIVGLAGRHTIREDGSLDLETTIFNHKGFPESFKPTWRFAEVAATDGMAFVMRNIGLRLDESLGLMHYYDLDISMQYIEAGYRVYNAGIDCWHLAGFGYESSRGLEPYLAQIGGDDLAYYDEVREKFRRKWQHLLPITRGYQDEAYALHRITELQDSKDDHCKSLKELERTTTQSDARRLEIEKAGAHIAKVEEALAASQAREEQLRAELERRAGAGPGGDAPIGSLGKVRHCLATEGLLSTAKRTGAYAVRKLKGSPKRGEGGSNA